MGTTLLRKACFILFLCLFLISSPAEAQLTGTDTAPGDSCAGFPAGAARLTADPDGDGTRITLICNGTIWLQEGVVVLSKTGAAPIADGTSISNINDIANVTITTPSDGEVLTYNSGSWINSAASGMWTAGAGDIIYYSPTTPLVGIGDTNPSVALDVVGDINYTGVIADVSDIRQKANIRNLTGALEKLRYIEGVTFTMKNDPKKRTEIGLIAQDVEKVYPELILTSKEGTLSLNYSGMVAPLIEAVKELDSENQTLKTNLHELSRRMDILEGRCRPQYDPYNN